MQRKQEPNIDSGADQLGWVCRGSGMDLLEDRKTAVSIGTVHDASAAAVASREPAQQGHLHHPRMSLISLDAPM